MDSTVLLDIGDDGVAVITLNRPAAANAWTVEMHVALQAALMRASTDETIRAVVLTGAGKHFCAGADLSMLEMFRSGTPIPAEMAQHTYLTPLRLRKPLIGAINGAAVGLGFATALMCDVRFASEQASFTTSFARLGLVAENGVSWLLPQIVGRSRAFDLLLTARRVTAEEALAIGLVDQIEPADSLLESAVRYAAQVAASASPASVAAIKEQVNRHTWAPVEVAEEESRILVAEAMAGADLTEALGAMAERRPPRFAGLGEGTRFSSFGQAPAQGQDEMTDTRAH